MILKWFLTSPTFVSSPAYGQSYAQQSLAQSFVFTRHWSTITWLAFQVLSCEVPASSWLGWFRAFALGLSSVERHRLEPRLTQEFLQVPFIYLLLYEFAFIYCLSVLCTDYWPMEMDKIWKERLASYCLKTKVLVQLLVDSKYFPFLCLLTVIVKIIYTKTTSNRKL